MTAAISEELKVGYVDTVKIFANYSKTVEAEEKYKQEIEEWRKKAKEMEAERAEMREAIQSQSLMLSEEKISEKRLELDQKIKEYQDYMQEIFGDQGEAAKRNQELTQPLVEEINSVIAEIAEEEGYTIIFDAAQGSLLYARDEIDMTDMVLERLKEKGTSMME
jgi:outer membrane protein